VAVVSAEELGGGFEGKGQGEGDGGGDGGGGGGGEEGEEDERALVLSEDCL
jgi:hypothetical protein